MGIKPRVIGTELKQFDEILMSNRVDAGHFGFNSYRHDLG